MLDRLIRALQVSGIEPEWRDLADILWLARLVTSDSEIQPTEREEERAAEPAPVEPRPVTTSSKTASDDDVIEVPQPSEPTTEPLPPTLGRTASAGIGATIGLNLRDPLRNALPGEREINRAIRPLKVKRASHRLRTLDVEGTVDFYCATGLLLPVEGPAKVRWFEELSIVLDAGPTMLPWASTVSALTRLFERYGAFDRVVQWKLIQGTAGIELVSAAGRKHSIRELIDYNGRRLTLVVSDCVGAMWAGPDAWTAIDLWGHSGPVALVQVLPERLWAATALGNVDAGISADRRGEPNRNLNVRLPWWWVSSMPASVLPVISLDPDRLTSWARMLMGSGAAVAGVTLPRLPLGTDRTDVRQRTPEERLEVFRSTVSTEASRLATMLSAVEVTLPIARLLLDRLVPGAKQIHLAEVLAGGLLTESGSGDGDFEFYPGVRELLQRYLNVTTTLDVWRAVSPYLEASNPSSAPFSIIEGSVAAPTAEMSAVVSSLGQRFGFRTPDAIARGAGITPRWDTAAPPAGTGDDVAPDQEIKPDQLADLKPCVVILEDGKLATGAPFESRDVGSFRTTAADIDAIFETHLPAFIAAHAPGPVPVVLYAQGGLVDKRTSLGVAVQQVAWWKGNGVYPIHFVWETGLGAALWDALQEWAAGGRRGWVDEAKDSFVEVAAQLFGGARIWNDIKLDAAAASVNGGGGHYFVRALARFMAEHPGEIEVHAVGHSAGSIFHAYLLQAALVAGVPRIESLNLLAPAVRVDTFSRLVMPHARSGKIARVAIFTMDDEAERADTCLRIYNKSLLYLVSTSLEAQRSTPILGMAKFLTNDPELADFFRGASADGDLVLAPNAVGVRTASAATSHGDFDTDAPTMESVGRRVAGVANVTPFPNDRGRTRAPWPAYENLPAGRAGSASGGRGARRALCIGVDAYPDEGDRLRGCVADARAWAEALTAAEFEVTEMTDAAATRDEILRGILELVSQAAPGDVLAVQYSGHGTFVPDLDADEEDGDVAKDEALCPVDFRKQGRFIIDDDLARIWDVIPEGVAFTAFFDASHSGSANRAPRIDLSPVGDSLPRATFLTMVDDVAYRVNRGADVEGSTTDPLRSAAHATVRASESQIPAPMRASTRRREVLFSACKPTEVAWESSEHGDFTRIALPLLTDGIGRVSNRDFVRQVVEQFGPNRRQTPEFHGEEVLGGSLLLTSTSTFAPNVPPSQAGMATSEPPSDDLGPGRDGRDEASVSPEQERAIRSLAETYDATRESMVSGPERTREMTRIFNAMVELASDVRPLLAELERSSSAGERLAAIAILSAYPRADRLEWLAERLDNPDVEAPFIGYQAARALTQAVRSLPLDAMTSVEKALSHALDLARKLPDNPNRITTLEYARQEVASRTGDSVLDQERGAESSEHSNTAPAPPDASEDGPIVSDATGLAVYVFAELARSPGTPGSFDLRVRLAPRASEPKSELTASQSISTDPRRHIVATIVPRGFRLAKEEPRSVELIIPDVNDVSEHAFRLIATEAGPAEVSLLLRQQSDLPLATLRLTAEIPESGSGPEPRTAVARIVEPARELVALPSVRVDEAFVKGETQLSVRASVRGEEAEGLLQLSDKRRFVASLYSRIAGIRTELADLRDSNTRARTALRRMTQIGSSLARSVLPPEVLNLLWRHRDELDGLIVQSNGEFDIPWELVHLVPSPGERDNGEVRFLGNTGLIRWVYDTPHPTEIPVAPGRARVVCPLYVDSRLRLVSSAEERRLLEHMIQATSIEPEDASGMHAMMRDGFDLFHFAGHCRWSEVEPPQQELLLAEFNHAAEEDPAWRYTVDDLRADFGLGNGIDIAAGPFVFLNAFDGGRTTSGERSLGGFAEAFLRGGAGVLVSCSWSLSDEPDSVFVEAFYQAFLDGQPLGEATRSARAAARDAGDLSELAYAVYGHPRARLRIT
ncbi:SAV_2336 N-terminal domain-related protein [Agromyces mariniharenae]|uniref:CHAT domain-containing protein n=1 Tax=Agromyces mariniharenae TaxID=2604423 RepID=A0A5S4UW99_9MICO|nr:SAV_2336 N-terminal domain-related protein [Agromyces mariniharenae]TYL51157.1 CHAT domain-containing protein [Agromyces mariniharenae]